MLIPLTEPSAPRYIYINPVTNRVHLLLPKEALAFDLSVLSSDSPLKQPKEKRLQQINDYIAAIEAVQRNPELNTLSGEFPAYPASLQTVMQEEQSNLYSMHLRPEVQDVSLRSINPVFSLNRKNNDSGNPDSVFYQTLQNTYKTLTLVPQDARARLISAVLASTEVENNDFKEMQQVLRQKTNEQLGMDINFTQTHTGQPVEQIINDSMMFDSTTTPAEYIDALLAFCAPNIFETATESPFYSARNAEELSIATQFFLGSANIYCASHGFSLDYYNMNRNSTVPLFPLVDSGLGVNFAFVRSNRGGAPCAARGGVPPREAALRDLEAASRLDEVRTADLTLSRTNLGWIEPERDHGARL